MPIDRMSYAMMCAPTTLSIVPSRQLAAHPENPESRESRESMIRRNIQTSEPLSTSNKCWISSLHDFESDSTGGMWWTGSVQRMVLSTFTSHSLLSTGSSLARDAAQPAGGWLEYTWRSLGNDCGKNGRTDVLYSQLKYNHTILPFVSYHWKYEIMVDDEDISHPGYWCKDPGFSSLDHYFRSS